MSNSVLTQTASKVPAALELKNFSFAYTADKPILDNISWSVPAGSFVIMTGATGCGKSTLLQCCKPELAPHGITSGALSIYDHPREILDTKTSAILVGYVNQNPETQIVCDSVWHELAFGLENLGVAADEMRRRVAEVAHFFGMGSWFHSDTASLSGGQKQLVNVASALALRPNLLLLDEPTSQLDPIAEKDFLHALFRVNRELGVTVVIATHAPESMLDYATHLAHLENGNITMRNITAQDLSSQFAPDSFASAQQRQNAQVATMQQAPCAAHTTATACAQLVAPSISARDVFVRYSRVSDYVLRGVTFDCCPGTITALIGANGSGKSTLLKSIGGALKAERGKLANNLHACQGYLPQNPKALLVCDTVLDELQEWQTPTNYTRADIDTLAAQLDIAKLYNHHPYDISGGQQQLVALAKVLLLRPKLLLLDEPTKGLDTASKTLIARKLIALKDSGATIIMSTHDLAFVTCVAQSVALVFDGEIACMSTPTDFFADNIFYKPLNDEFLRNWNK